MPQYALARHVFVCLQGEHVVFLDVRKDRYFALESSRTAGLGELVPGWPVPAPAPVIAEQVRYASQAAVSTLVEQVDRGMLTAVIALLFEKEILTAVAGAGKSAEPVRAEALRTDLAAEGSDEGPRVDPGTCLRFVSAAIRARLMLKYRSLESVVERVRARLERAQDKEAPFDVARVHHLVGVFATLRPFFFTAKDACLFDALALSEFLAGYGMLPRWVFAVQARPFAAHCWLQHGGIVLNDTVEHVKRYTPIMVV